MDAKKLAAFVSAVDLGSFSKASETVGYTQSGLTHLVNALEKEIGFPVITRDHNGISLNEQGKQLMPYIRSFLLADEKMGEKIQEIRNEGKKRIRIAAYSSMALNWLPEILYQFARICPEVEVNLRMVDHALEPFELLKEGRADVIFASWHPDMQCEWFPLYNERMLAVVPMNDPVQGNTYPIENMDGTVFLMPYGSFDQDVHAIFEKAGITAEEKNMHVDDETLVRMVATGMGVTIMSELMIRGRTDDVRCLPIMPESYRQLGVGVRKEDVNHPVLQKLKKCVLEYLDVRLKGKCLLKDDV